MLPATVNTDAPSLAARSGGRSAGSSTGVSRTDRAIASSITDSATSRRSAGWMSAPRSCRWVSAHRCQNCQVARCSSNVASTRSAVRARHTGVAAGIGVTAGFST